MYLGHLLSISDYKAFGFYSHTHIKVIIICDQSTPESGNIRDVLLTLFGYFTSTVLNPFQETGGVIKSKKFNFNVQQLIQKYNSGSNALLGYRK